MRPGDVRAIAPSSNFTDKEQQKRLRSNMLVLNGGQENKLTTQDEKTASEALGKADPNTAFSDNVLKSSGAEKAAATRVTNLSITILQGKVVNAVLETAVNTDLPGSLRAIVSRDVYAESGREVMIPRGSRLIGTYNTGISRGQRRVMIIWTRLIRPDGLDIAIGSPGIDSLGRAGIEGVVDNKYSEIFSAAILTSAISIGAATAADALTPGQSTTTNNANGTTTSGGAGAAGAAAAVTTMGDVGKSLVNSLLDQKPTITIDQGTRVSIFVNKDLVFPSAAANSTFVQ
ncbi:MAG: TrbI/VirB10 family protein [Alphaproteobacteria bacterium]|nr:TrbI/VirB10 family protein [Alphaproteobacteria bacterium]